ncbi:hypothetical protein FRX31_026875 [Thalictrum thalictroides]|uniref:Uncharacterized protein n=1 Tax=Thalictrum thalictroides TaxID=46969 RepID=A0A7J6VEL6_THATH|nr:hypothetical protein FRX31_026875 [Thalictrum thalictroides]
MQKNGNLIIYKKDLQKYRNQVHSNVDFIRTGMTGVLIIERNQVDSTDDPGECRWESRTHKKLSPIVLNLDSTGHLSLVDWDGLVIRNLTEAEEHPSWSIVGSLIYRATLEQDGI